MVAQRTKGKFDVSCLLYNLQAYHAHKSHYLTLVIIECYKIYNSLNLSFCTLNVKLKLKGLKRTAINVFFIMEPINP